MSDDEVFEPVEHISAEDRMWSHGWIGPGDAEWNERQRRAEKLAEQHIREVDESWVHWLDGRQDWTELARNVSGYLDGECFIKAAAVAKDLRAQYVEFLIDSRAVV